MEIYKTQLKFFEKKIPLLLSTKYTVMYVYVFHIYIYITIIFKAIVFQWFDTFIIIIVIKFLLKHTSAQRVLIKTWK